ncbi:DNA-binding transcriptional ArsR family regulator [Deinobacterium chartae]|uniref:DNA-binding transcriptional ArsR family regulator n=1 Tax=Deinobacterium chartae TaxID=521158 RepID=A0A841HVU2_9DEIO|nr:hypothetical protein [Deinobacterium chartae]MBB6096953.1 DNA-binding transcriptional ArsR family regulator [Deinobacterium chartae]
MAHHDTPNRSLDPAALEPALLEALRVGKALDAAYLADYTGYPLAQVRAALEALCERGEVRLRQIGLLDRRGRNRRVYELAHPSPAPSATGELTELAQRIHRYLLERPDTAWHLALALRLSIREVGLALASLEAHRLLSRRRVGKTVLYLGQPAPQRL